jgi:hypothetical protein
MRRMVKDAQSAEPAPPPVPAADAQKKNPVKPTPDGLAEAKKLYGYHCAMKATARRKKSAGIW